MAKCLEVRVMCPRKGKSPLLTYIAGVHSPLLQRRIRRLQLCRIHPLFRPLAIWRIGPPVPERVYRQQGQRDGYIEPFLPAGRLCGAAVARGARGVVVLWCPRPRSRRCPRKSTTRSYIRDHARAGNEADLAGIDSRPPRRQSQVVRCRRQDARRQRGVRGECAGVYDVFVVIWHGSQLQCMSLRSSLVPCRPRLCKEI